MYKKLVEFYNKGKLSFKYVKTFNMDEYVGLPRDHAESYHSFMWENFFKFIDIEPSNAHILDGNAEDLTAECDNYEAKITEAGGIHLFVGGTARLLTNNIFCFPIRYKVGALNTRLIQKLLEASSLHDTSVFFALKIVLV